LLGCGKDNDDIVSSSIDGIWILESHSCDFSQTTQLENESYAWLLNTTQVLLTVEST